MTLQEKIDKLESNLREGAVAGTALNRILMDNTLLPEHGIEGQGRESTLVWCLTVGEMLQPWKKFYYGLTIDDAVEKAMIDVCRNRS